MALGKNSKFFDSDDDGVLQYYGFYRDYVLPCWVLRTLQGFSMGIVHALATGLMFRDTDHPLV